MLNRIVLKYLFTVMVVVSVTASPVWGAQKPCTVTVALGGDVYLGGGVLKYLKKNKKDYYFKSMEKLFKESDVSILNLEVPFTDHKEKFMEKLYIMKAPDYMVGSLTGIGIDAVSLANNHMMDYGKVGLEDTLEVLDKACIEYSGAGVDLSEARTPAVVTISGGVKVALLSYSKTYPLEFYAKRKRAGTAPGYMSYVKKDVELARENADIVVVAFHWGSEFMKTPRSYQKELAKAAIDSGAQIVVGHHPHVLQGVESYKGGIILYSLGNLVFGTLSRGSVEGMVAKVTLLRGDDGSYSFHTTELLPLDVENRVVRYGPSPIEGEAAESLLKELTGKRLMTYEELKKADKKKKRAKKKDGKDKVAGNTSKPDEKDARKEGSGEGDILLLDPKDAKYSKVLPLCIDCPKPIKNPNFLLHYARLCGNLYN